MHPYIRRHVILTLIFIERKVLAIFSRPVSFCFQVELNCPREESDICSRKNNLLHRWFGNDVSFLVLENHGEIRRDRESVHRQFDRRLKQTWPCHLAATVLLERREKPVQLWWRRNCPITWASTNKYNFPMQLMCQSWLSIPWCELNIGRDSCS